MNQLDSHFYKPVVLNKRASAAFMPTINNCPNRNLHFAFQFDRNMARQFHSETMVAAANFQRGNMFL
jgi:hypothetical protein